MKFLEELLATISRTHPHIALLVVLITTGVVGYSYRVFAEDLDLQRLEHKHDTEFASLSLRLDYGFAELKLKHIEGQIFTLERASQTGDSFSSRDAERLSELKSELGALVREMSQIRGGA